MLACFSCPNICESFTFCRLTEIKLYHRPLFKFQDTSTTACRKSQTLPLPHKTYNCNFRNKLSPTNIRKKDSRSRCGSLYKVIHLCAQPIPVHQQSIPRS